MSTQLAFFTWNCKLKQQLVKVSFFGKKYFVVFISFTVCKGAFWHDLADPLNSMFKNADPFSASATSLYRSKHFLVVTFFLEIYTPRRKNFNVEIS